MPKDRLTLPVSRMTSDIPPMKTRPPSGWPGIDPGHILFFGRKENFWEMARKAMRALFGNPLDRGERFAIQRHATTVVNGDCNRYLELWNNAFIQQPHRRRHLNLAGTHVMGMGFERSSPCCKM